MSAHFPQWIRRSWASGEGFSRTLRILRDLHLHTVCQSARCPNQGECWSRGTATFLILGNVCTRHCGFCGVTTGAPVPADSAEPGRIAECVRQLGLRHAVITSVTRDDLPDGGAGQFARTIAAIRALNPATGVEVLVPDFGGSAESLDLVVEAVPDVVAHNIETVRRLFGTVRDTRADYDRSMAVLEQAARRGTLVKSGLMVGLGETESEIAETLKDLYAAGCRSVTIGQYLRPRADALPVAHFAPPEQFEVYRRKAETMGFAHVMAGPFVRSSYYAENVWNKEGKTVHAL